MRHAVAVYLKPRCAGLCRDRDAAAKNDPYASDDFTRRERLGHIVVRADFQPDDTVDLIRARSEKQDRDVSQRTRLAADLETAHVRQADVQYRQRVAAAAQLLQGVAAQRAMLRGIPL